MRKVKINTDDLQNKKMVAGFEGGVISTAEKNGKYYIISDESTMASFLDEEDLDGIDLINIYEFDDITERTEYIKERYVRPNKRTYTEGDNLNLF